MACSTAQLLEPRFGMGISPTDIIMPAGYGFSNNYFRPWMIYMPRMEEKSGQVTKNDGNFKISLDVQQFRPNELSVKTSKMEIIITGKHEERQDEFGFISREFTRKYLLPTNCNSDEVTCSLSADGILTIMMMKEDKTMNADYREVPIKMSEAISKVESTLTNGNKTSEANVNVISQNSKEMNGEQSKNVEKLLLKEDHCRLLNLDGTLKHSIKNRIDDSKEIALSEINKSKETIDKTMCKSDLISDSFNQIVSDKKMEVSEEFQKLATDKMSSTNSCTTDMGSFTMSSEKIQSMEGSFSTSMSYDMKSEKSSEFTSKIITTDTKQIMENM